MPSESRARNETVGRNPECALGVSGEEDGEGPEATNAVTFDPDDDSIIHLLHKGKPVSFELDKVFSSQASQQDVSVAPAWRGTERHTSHEGGEMGEGWTKINVREGRQDGEA